MEDLVGVDVADPGDDVLVEQQRLERTSSGTERPPQGCCVERLGDRVDAEPGEFGQFDGDAIRVEHDHLAERARIDEPCLVAVVEMQHDVGVGRAIGPRRGEEHLSAHPQMDHRGVTRVERQQQVLATSVGSRRPRCRTARR